MHPNAYTTLAAMETVGWYYQARARCVARLIERYVAPDSRPLEILDVGCGTGGTSCALAPFGRVTGLEPSPMAIELLKSRYADMNVIPGSVDDLDALVPPASFDLATIMGVLYHRGVADPAAALCQVNRALQPAGWLIWNEGVYPILARAHDAFVDAGRRFRPREMHSLAEGAGFQVRFASHLLGWAFPIALTLAGVQRAKQRWTAPAEDHSPDDRPLPRPLNATLRELTCFEWACSLRGLKLPFGVSYLLIARKKTP